MHKNMSGRLTKKTQINVFLFMCSFCFWHHIVSSLWRTLLACFWWLQLRRFPEASTEVKSLSRVDSLRFLQLKTLQKSILFPNFFPILFPKWTFISESPKINRFSVSKSWTPEPQGRCPSWSWPIEMSQKRMNWQKQKERVLNKGIQHDLKHVESKELAFKSFN